MSSSSLPLPQVTIIHKGKLTNRSWPQLPPEIIRWIATYCLLDATASLSIPDTWHAPALWENRMVYTMLRTAQYMELLMQICPQWHLALEKHTFWDQACCHLDPYGVFDRHRIVHNQASSAPPHRRTAYRHYQMIYESLCVICRLNRPSTQCPLIPSENRREVWVPALERIPVCRHHRRTMFCGACLRDGPLVDARGFPDDAADIGLAGNEDHRTFQYIQTTCRQCRSSELWRAMSTCFPDREAVGGGPQRHWNAADPETRQAIELFIETGEGTVADVANIAREKYWLQKHTRVADFLEEAVAAHRLSERMDIQEIYESQRLDGDLEDDRDEDFDDMTLPEHFAQARELAINDWARTRVLDGHWVTPADEWYGTPFQITRAVHPAPWTQAAEDPARSPEQHPSPTLLRMARPATFTLAENLYRAFLQQLREILAPALSNIVRRIMLTATDPALYAARMQVQDVLHELHRPYAWSKELNIESLPSLPPPRRRIYKDDASSSPSSHESHGSETSTSPVLSASTLQTTPSPPPREKLEVAETDAELPTPLSPTGDDGFPPPDPANMLHTIPYIPVSLAQLPLQTSILVQQFWREQCAPLYQCSCGICARAIRTHYTTQLHSAAPVVPAQQLPPQMQIQLTESHFPVDEEEELSEDDEYAEEWEYDTDGDEVEESPEVPTIALQPAPIFERTLNSNGKRAVRYEEEEEAGDEEAAGDADAFDSLRQVIGQRMSNSTMPARAGTPPRANLKEPDMFVEPGTPPKRTRLVGEYSPTAVSVIPPRLVKRRSEDAPEDESHKRARVEVLDAETATT